MTPTLVRSSRLLGVGLALLSGCARWEIETVGTAPTVTEVALVAGSGEFVETVQRALEAESIRVVEREGAQFLLHARFELEFHSRPYIRPAGPPNPRDHRTGQPGIGYGYALPTSNDLETGRFEPPPVTECVAVLTLKLVRAPTGAHLWTGRALDLGGAANWRGEHLESAVRCLVRALRSKSH